MEDKLAVDGGKPIRKNLLRMAKVNYGYEELSQVLEVFQNEVFCSVDPRASKVKEFEKLFAEYIGVKYALSFSSGTTAQHASLVAAGVGEGDEVIVPPLTFVSTAYTVTLAGAKPVFVDVDDNSITLNPEKIKNAITDKTKAIVPVHWFGYPADMDKVMNIARENKLMVIEDCAHGFGSKYKGKYLGNHNNFVMNSLQAIKHITSVDGGLLFCPHDELYERAKLLRWYGIDRNPKGRTDFRCEADIAEWGFKFHMNDVCAAVGIENFQHMNNIVSKHKDNAAYYDLRLQNAKGVKLLKREEGFESAFWIYSLLVDDRPSFYEYMKECNIMVSQVHERNDKHSCMEEFKSDLPKLEKTIDKIVSIPVGWWVTEEQRKYIVDCIRKWK